MNADQLEAEAEALLAAMAAPRRRVRPRVAAALVDAEHQMIDGIAAWRLGSGPATLLVHGWEDDTSLWGPLIDALALRGRAVVAFDLPAHGYSQGDSVDIESAAAAVARVAQAFGPVDSAGAHSFGCKAVIFGMAEAGAAFERVALIGAPVTQTEQWARLTARYGVPEPVARCAQALREARAGRPLAAYDVKRLAPAMTARALFAHSVDDDACPFADVADLAAAWPDAETLFVDGLGHRLVAQDPEIVAAIAAFLDP